MSTHAPKKYLISHTSLQHCFDKSRSGLEKLRETDASFPRPIKFGPSKQAGVYFVVAEAPGVRIVVASPIFPKKAYRGRKETGRAVLFT